MVVLSLNGNDASLPVDRFSFTEHAMSFKEYLLPGITFLKRESYLDTNKVSFNILFEEFKKQNKSDYYIFTHVPQIFDKVTYFSYLSHKNRR